MKHAPGPRPAADGPMNTLKIASILLIGAGTLGLVSGGRDGASLGAILIGGALLLFTSKARE